MNLVDLLLLFLFLMVIFIGFSVGLIRMVCVVIGMYVGVNIAALTYVAFAGLTAEKGNPVSQATAEVVWFGVVWVVSSIIFTLVAFSFLRYIVLPGWLRNIEQLTGLVAGMFVGIFGLLVIGYVFQNSLALALASSQCSGGPTRFFASGFQNSLLMHVFNGVKVVLLDTLSPWLPTNRMPVFADYSSTVRACGI